MAERKILSIPNPFEHRGFLKVLQFIWNNSNVRNVFLIYGTLNFFYAIMVFYVPIYLNQTIGFDWTQLGVMFTLMLLPFVIFQIPAGTIADKWLGEKEMAIFGLIIMMLAVLLMHSTTSSMFALWAVILFASRVGAAILEAMIETHFFKHVDVEDVGVINTFRSIRPGGYLLGAAAGAVVLVSFDIRFLFLCLLFVLFVSLWPLWVLVDSK